MHALSGAVILAGLLFLAVAAYGYWLSQKVSRNELTSSQANTAKWIMMLVGILLLLLLLSLVNDRSSTLCIVALLVASIFGSILAFYIFSILNGPPGSHHRLVGSRNLMIASMVIAVIVLIIGLYCVSQASKFYRRQGAAVALAATSRRSSRKSR